jgi:PAS domain S-box-containing protein
VLVKSRTVFAGEGAQRHAIHVSGVVVDVTERRRAEEALRQSEERLRLLTERFQTALQASPVVAFNQDRDLRYTWIYNSSLGFDPESIIGLRDQDLFERNGDAEVIESIKSDVLLTGEPRRSKVRLLHQGVEHAYDLIVHPLHDGEGRVDGVTCAAIDITDAKRSEEALRTRNERLRLLSTTASQLVLRGTGQGPTPTPFSRVSSPTWPDAHVEMHLHYRTSEPNVPAHIERGAFEQTRNAAATLAFGDSLCGTVASTGSRLIVEDMQTSDSRPRVSCGVSASEPTPGSHSSRAGASSRPPFATAHRNAFEPDEIALIQTVCDS